MKALVLVMLTVVQLSFGDVVVVRPHWPHPKTQVVYQCPPGPGYMKIVAVNDQANKVTKILSTYSKEYCDAQLPSLIKNRSEIRRTVLFGICSQTLPFNGKTSAYLSIYSIDAFANIYFQTRTFYENAPDQCLKDAENVNK